MAKKARTRSKETNFDAIKKLLVGMTREDVIAAEIACRAELMKSEPSDYDARMIAKAVKEHVKDGECEIDEGSAVVSESDDGGAYVQAWVWVYDRWYCQDCEHEDNVDEFWPSDGRDVDHICPKCGSTNVFPKDEDE